MEIEEKFEMFVGTYTKAEGHVDGKAAGISSFDIAADGSLENSQLIADDIINPSYLQLSADGQFLYAASETGPDVDSVAYIQAYARKGDGSWSLLNRQSSHSFAPCYIAVHPNGKVIAAANYVGGVVALYPLNEDGSLQAASTILQLEGSTDHPRQESSHPHGAVFSPDGQYCYIPDLGANKIWIYRYQETDHSLVKTEPGFIEVPEYSGPRHFIFHPKGNWAYVANELSNTVNTFSIAADGYNLNLIETLSTRPDKDDLGDSYVADIHMTGNGEHLYVSNRGDNTLAHFTVNPTDGKLTAKGYYSTEGEFPRNFVISPDDKYVWAANQNSSTITSYKIQEDGSLEQIGIIDSPTPVCLQIVQK